MDFCQVDLWNSRTAVEELTCCDNNVSPSVTPEMPTAPCCGNNASPSSSLTDLRSPPDLVCPFVSFFHSSMLVIALLPVLSRLSLLTSVLVIVLLLPVLSRLPSFPSTSFVITLYTGPSPSVYTTVLPSPEVRPEMLLTDLQRSCSPNLLHYHIVVFPSFSQHIHTCKYVLL